jgi:hypothetical protein
MAQQEHSNCHQHHVHYGLPPDHTDLNRDHHVREADRARADWGQCHLMREAIVDRWDVEDAESPSNC